MAKIAVYDGYGVPGAYGSDAQYSDFGDGDDLALQAVRWSTTALRARAALNPDPNIRAQADQALGTFEARAAAIDANPGSSTRHQDIAQLAQDVAQLALQLGDPATATQLGTSVSGAWDLDRIIPGAPKIPAPIWIGGLVVGAWFLFGRR